MKKKYLTFFQLFYVMAIFMFATTGCEASDWKEELSQEVELLMAQQDIKGATMVIVEGDQTIFSKGFGYADMEQGIEVTPETVFRVGSISKLFTATSIMQLQEEGLLDIDRPLVEYLPDFRCQSRPGINTTSDDITLRHMLTHHSGLPSDFFHGNYHQMPPDFEEFTAQFANEYLAQEPDQFWSYSNSAFNILGHVVQSVSGQPFSDYVEEKILAPLGMEHSSFECRADIEARLSKNYSGGEQNLPIAETAAGNLYSNSDDMAKFIRVILNQGTIGDRRILNATTLEEMHRVQNGDNQLDQAISISIGLCWQITQDELIGKIVGHGGGLNGFLSNLILMPDQNIGIFLSVNTPAEASGALMDSAVRWSLKGRKNIIFPAAPFSTNPVLPSLKLHPVAFTEDDLNSLPGIYSTTGPIIKLRRFGRRIKADAFGNHLELKKLNDGTFGFYLPFTPLRKLPDITLEFRQFQNRDVVVLNKSALLPKLNPVQIPAQWYQHVGTYLLEPPAFSCAICETLAKIRLEINDGVLTAIANDQREAILVPFDERHAYIHGIGRGAGETIWFDDAGKLHFLGNYYNKQASADNNIVSPVTTDPEIILNRQRMHRPIN